MVLCNEDMIVCSDMCEAPPPPGSHFTMVLVRAVAWSMREGGRVYPLHCS